MDYAPLAAVTLSTVVRRPGLEPGEVKPLDLQSRPLPATEYRPILSPGFRATAISIDFPVFGKVL